MFTGDHVLPGDQPASHDENRLHHRRCAAACPVHYQDPDDSYGLLTYLRSLQRVADLGDGGCDSAGPSPVQQPQVQLPDAQARFERELEIGSITID